MNTQMLLSGSAAAARGACEAGAAWACGYPGTPATEILDAVAALEGTTLLRTANEKVALEVAMGVSQGGRRALAVMKHIGLNIASDAIVASVYAGVGGGLVITAVDDPGLLASMNEQDTRHFARAARIPMFAPSDAQEIHDFTRMAFSFSEQYDVPVIVRLTTRLCYTHSLCTVGERIESAQRASKLHAPKTRTEGMRRHEHLEKQLAAIESFGNQAFDLNTIDVGSNEVGIITSGISYAYAKEVLPDASFLKLGLIHPLPKKLIAYFASLVQRLYVIEELDPFLEEQIRAMGIDVIGKEAFPRTGELSADIVAAGLVREGVTAPRPTTDASPLPLRVTTLCSHCAHRSLMNAFQKLALTVVGDVGCHTPGDLPPADPDELDVCYGEGSSMSVAFGHALARGGDSRDTVAVLSGSTFLHSGLPALATIVENGGTATVCIMASASHAAAATGTSSIDFARLCEGVGVARVLPIAAGDEEAAERALADARMRDGVTVIISS